ncbi:hypothetical protein B0T16DRAFT_214481 [Cercophora newfieldiana]|uniref:Prolyl 4-hydroxylase alpha subunit domain-containing protein n=1 Tax=Cercophora newfieldiana TaxID=92897 RepID=A0AA40CL34_9PEZI|nr:hypothetical protein B0T16DRAFT_214481 [Cercophora newfieldiana]
MATPVTGLSTPFDRLKDGLCEVLNSIKSAGSFAAVGKLGQTTLKPIAVKDVGPVEYPLAEPMARQLIGKARQAPFGKGNKTIVDTSVRNTWELDASQLDLSPEWDPVIKTVCRWAAQQLGITEPISAELYKMLIYEKGAMFKAHTDSEKAPGMFGTLVICLPSEHQGGDLVLKHRDVTKVFKTSEAQPSISCWFSDVSHEVLPVISGIRWVLTYNLVMRDPVQTPCAALNPSYHESLKTALQAWAGSPGSGQNGQQPDHLYYLMDHTYTEANFSLNKLKGSDLARMRCLKDVCDELDLSLFFGVLQKEEQGSCEDDYDRYGYKRGYYDDDSDDWHEFEEVFETDIFIKKLITTEGRAVRTGMEITMRELEEKLVQRGRDPFEKAERGEADYSGFTGNEGVSAMHWYRKTVAVIIPNSLVDMFLTKSITNEEAQKLLPEYLSKCSDSAIREQGIQMVRHLAELAWSPVRDGMSTPFHYCGPKIAVEVVIKVAHAALRYHEYDLFNKIVEWLKNQVGPWMFSIIKEVAAEDLTLDFTQIKASLRANLTIRSVSDRMSFLAALSPSDGETPNVPIQDWIANEVMLDAEQACLGPRVTANDGKAIVDMIKEYRDLDHIKNGELSSVIEQQAKLVPFSLSALLQILQFAKQEVFDKAATLEFCKPLLASVLNNLDASTLITKEGAEAEYAASKPHGSDRFNWHQMNQHARSRPDQAREKFITPDLLSGCLARCIEAGWDDLAMRFCLKIAAKADSIPPVEFHHLWVPFVRQLITTLDEANVPLSTPRYQQLACSILEAYLDKYVGREPTGAVDYSGQGPVSCTCGDCCSLNSFLASGERTWSFSAVKKRREHVERYIAPGLGCTYRTESRGSPYTLIVTKNIDSGAKAKKDWTARFAEAWDAFTKFDESKLKLLLGADWEKITSMRHLRLSPTAQMARPMPVREQEVGGGGGSQSALDGYIVATNLNKRKAEEELARARFR